MYVEGGGGGGGGWFLECDQVCKDIQDRIQRVR